MALGGGERRLRQYLFSCFVVVFRRWSSGRRLGRGSLVISTLVDSTLVYFVQDMWSTRNENGDFGNISSETFPHMRRSMFAMSPLSRAIPLELTSEVGCYPITRAIVLCDHAYNPIKANMPTTRSRHALLTALRVCVFVIPPGVACSVQVDKKDLTSSDPYLKMARVLESGDHTYVFKTEVQSRTLNPEWRTIQVSKKTAACRVVWTIDKLY